jgi:DNA-binding NarL/FixJ family response regulator
MPQAAVRTLIVDDQPTFRRVARALVGTMPDFELIGEAASGEEALDLFASLEPDLVLMDLNLGDSNGIAASQGITSRRPETVVVLTSTYAPEDLPADAATCGASAYVSKEHLDPGLLRTIWNARSPKAPEALIRYQL